MTLENPTQIGYFVVTVHRFANVRLVIYSNDHEPAHVHAEAPGASAKIQLEGGSGPALIWQHGFSPSDLRQIMAEVLSCQARLLARWSEIHG